MSTERMTPKKVLSSDNSIYSKWLLKLRQETEQVNLHLVSELLGYNPKQVLLQDLLGVLHRKVHLPQDNPHFLVLEPSKSQQVEDSFMELLQEAALCLGLHLQQAPSPSEQELVEDQPLVWEEELNSEPLHQEEASPLAKHPSSELSQELQEEDCLEPQPHPQLQPKIPTIFQLT